MSKYTAILTRLHDTATMRSILPPWVCEEMLEAAQAIEDLEEELTEAQSILEGSG